MTAKILYTVSCLEPHTHYFDVEVRVDACRPGPVRLAMPVWTPGAYQVHDFAGRVHDVRFQDAAGRALRQSKVDKSTWEARAGGDGTVVARYKVFAYDVDVDKSFVDDRRATINGASVYMYVVDRKEEPHRVTFSVPPSWKRIDTGLTPVAGAARTFVAKDYDELVDCPVMMGNHRVETFTVRGVKHSVVLVGEGNYEIEPLMADMRKIVESSIDVFGDLPYSRYVFFMEMTPEGYGGLEHCNSTHMLFPAWGFKPRKEYVVALGLISHEFFHTWNVKRLRPAPLGPFDYSKEVYTPLLWFAEGFTSYYDLVVLRRAGCITPREYLDELAREIRRLTLSPGRNHQSLEESSFDTWIKLYRPTPDSPNTSISYYNKGCLFGLALDLEIRHLTANRKSLDDVMKHLYHLHYRSSGKGMGPDDVEKACAEVAGRSLAPIFDRIVRGRGEVDWGRYLRLAGLEIASKQESTPAKKLKAGDEKDRAYLGLRLKPGGLFVSQVVSGSGAYSAGLAPGDELIALDGFRLDESRLDRWLGHLAPGTTVRLTTARAGRLREITVRLTRRPLIDLSIQPTKRASAAQKALLAAWIDDRWSKIDRPQKGVDFRPRERVW